KYATASAANGCRFQNSSNQSRTSSGCAISVNPKYSLISEDAGTRRCLGGAAKEAVDPLRQRGDDGQRSNALIAPRTAIQRQTAAMQAAQNGAGESTPPWPQVATVNQAWRGFKSASQDGAGNRVGKQFFAQLVRRSLARRASGHVFEPCCQGEL